MFKKFKTLFFVGLLLAFQWAQAHRTKLLDCNVYSGDFQQITVIQEANQALTLQRLTSSGRWIESPLANSQWQKKNITVPCARSEASCGQVYLSKRDWVYSLGEAGFFEYGFCQ